MVVTCGFVPHDRVEICPHLPSLSFLLVLTNNGGLLQYHYSIFLLLIYRPDTCITRIKIT